jgi:hypothetical protein
MFTFERIDSMRSRIGIEISNFGVTFVSPCGVVVAHSACKATERPCVQTTAGAFSFCFGDSQARPHQSRTYLSLLQSEPCLCVPQAFLNGSLPRNRGRNVA